MPPEQTQPPQNLPQEADQDALIIQFLQELENRVVALEEKMSKEDTEDAGEEPKDKPQPQL